MMEDKSSSIVYSLEGHLSFLRACIFSMTSKEKRTYADRIRKTVEEYKPKIEEKTGIQLDETKVLPYMTALNKGYLKTCKELILGSPKQDTKPISKIERALLVTLGLPFTLGITAGFYPIYALAGLQRNSSAMFNGGLSESDIAFTTGLATRMDLWAEKYLGKNLHLPSAVVHELSHHLWDKIAESRKEKLTDFFNKTQWSEGFATYCETEFFRDLYPRDYNMMSVENRPSRYKLGKQKVEQAVQAHGLDILLQIPNKWPELQGELK